jgi:amidase
MTTAPLNELEAVEIAALVRSRAIGPVEVTEACLAAIERLNPELNAFCCVAAAEARAAAQAAETRSARHEPTGPLHGVPVSIKDITATAGIRTTHGSPLLADNVPPEDAIVVARLKQAGAIVIGKTNTPEFAAGANTVNRLFGATRNPWDPQRTVGGSTGGGAASLAAFMVPLAEGSDFGGSLRTPAAFCGVVGLRPTPGLVPGRPDPMPWELAQTHGPMARTARDCALMLDAIVGVSDAAPVSMKPPWHSALEAVAAPGDLRGLRVAHVADICGIPCEPEIAQACRAAADALTSAGATVGDATLDLSGGRESYLALRGQWMVGRHLEYIDSLERLPANLAGNIQDGLNLTMADLARAEWQRAALWEQVVAFFGKWDLMITPTTLVSPFTLQAGPPTAVAGVALASYIDWVAPTFLISLFGLPAASVPCGLTSGGLPIGAQIVGRRFSEPTILRAADFVQRALPIGRPPGSGA